jgi:hypothetical protein
MSIDASSISVEDPDWQKAWEKEISRRAAEMDRGEVTPIPWEDAMRTIEEYRDGKTRRNN